MNVQAYYKRHISYTFNEQKQRGIFKSYSQEQLKTELNRQLTIQKECLFDKVNSRENNQKMINLLNTLTYERKHNN